MKNHSKILTQASLLQSFQSLELRNPYHLPDFQPAVFELKTYTNRVRSIALAFFILGLIAISTTSSFQLWQLQPSIAAENALLELVQGLFLLLALGVQGVRAYSAPKLGLIRDIRSGLALFALLLFLREMDIDKIGVSTHWALAEQMLRGIALLLTLRFILHVTRRREVIMSNLANIFWSPTLLVSLLGCLFYTCGWPFDKELFTINKGLSVWLEETLELKCLFIVVMCRLYRRCKIDCSKTKRVVILMARL